MSGTLIRRGRYRSAGSGSGPDFATAGANEQIATFTNPGNPGSTQLIAYSMGGWFGVNSGSPTSRAGIMFNANGGPGPDNRRPGGVAARTVEFTPTAGYNGSNEGQFIDDINLEAPYLMATNHDHVVALASRNGATATSMVVAGDISEPNEYLYRKNISGTNFSDGNGSSGTNEGQLNIWINAEENVGPTAPTNVEPSGNISTRRPLLAADFNDVNKVLNNGVDWDHITQTRVVVRRVSDNFVMWDHTYDSYAAERQNHRSAINYDGQPLLFHVPYEVMFIHWDRGGKSSPWSTLRQFTILHNNSRPNTPSNPSGIGDTQGTRSITVSHDFTDPDLPLLADGQAWERFEQKRVVVRRLSDNNLELNSTTNTTSTEKANRRSSTTFTLPAWDTWYKWTEYHIDRSGVSSFGAERLVRAVSGGYIETPSMPTGRKTDPTNPGPIHAIYRTSAGVNTTMMRARLMNEYNDVITTSAWKNISVPTANGITMTWAESGFGTMPNGATRGVQVVAQDANGNFTEWSDTVWFQTNARPDTPILFAPVDGFVASSLPIVYVYATDDDSGPGELDLEIVYFDAATNTNLGTKAMTHHSGAGYRDIDPGTIISGYGTYEYAVRSNDGYLDSYWTARGTFTYAPVPAVEITAPTGPTITTSQPFIEATTDAHVAWRVVGRNDANETVYDTSNRPGTFVGHTVIDSYYWKNGERWNNGETFNWSVGVQNASGLWGWSEAVSLTLDYIPPDPLLVESVEALAFPGCDGTHYIATQIQQSPYGTGAFISYNVDRMAIDGPGGNVIPGTLEPDYFVEGSSAHTLFTDFNVTSNQWYRYGFRVLVQSGVDVIESEPVYSESMASFHGTMLHMPFDPLSTFVWLPYGTQQYEPEAEWFQGGNEMMSANAMAPTYYSDGSDYVAWRLESTLVPRGDFTPEQQLAAFRTMWSYQNHRKAPNGRPNSITFREGRGGDDGCVTGRISMPTHRHSFTRLYTITFEFRELGEQPAEGGVQ